MKYDLNELIKNDLGKIKKGFIQDCSKELDRLMARGEITTQKANQILHRSSRATTYANVLENITEELKLLKLKLSSSSIIPKPKKDFEEILKSNNKTQIGYCYLIGYGTKMDLDEARKYLEESDKGRCLLAKAYIVGKGVPQDFNEAYAVYPSIKNPVGDFLVYINGENITVRKLLFGKDEA